MRFVYLMQRQRNNIVFLVDAEPTESEDYSPQGQIYPNPSDHLQKILATGKAFTEGPITDARGPWMSAHAPIRDPISTNIIAIIGLDIDINTWENDTTIDKWGSISVILVLISLATVYFSALIGEHNARLKQKKQQRNYANANQDLNAFTTEASHDLRAPLLHISGFSNILENEYRQVLTGNGLMYLSRLKKAARTIDHLINAFLNLARIKEQTLGKTPLDLSKLVQATVAQRKYAPERLDGPYIPSIEIQQ